MISITEFFGAIKEIDPRITKVRIADSLGISRAALNYFIMKDNVKDAFILPEVMGSDHCPLGIEVEF